jgi:hypothetical protein
MYTNKKNRLRVETTQDGSKILIMPRYSLARVTELKGVLDAVVDGDNGTQYKTLKGINRADFLRIKPDRMFYELADGTLLEADLELFEGSEMADHNATQDHQVCYKHWVNQLRVVPMPEIKEIPVFSFV